MSPVGTQIHCNATTIVKPINLPPEASYVTWEDERGKAIAIHQATAAIAKVEPILRTFGSDIFLNIGPGNTSVRDGFGRGDYESFRREEALPSKPKDIIQACMCAYDAVGIIRNVIDLMSDFAVQGLDIVHPNERIEKFHKEWFRRVNGFDRSERFLNVFYRCGNVIVKRQTAKLGAKDEERLRRATAAPDIEVQPPSLLLKREVPWRYIFLNPLTVEVLADQVAPFVGPDAFVYAVKVPDAVLKIIKSPKGAEKQVVAKLPADVRKIIASGSKYIPLDPDKIWVSHYKRDDWCAWAKPMLAPLLKDLNMLEKMKMADLAALDGAISSIRVWKLGSLEAKIMPSEAIILRLAQMLNNNVGGGVMDLVWGPDIELLETSTEVYKFLGETKYAPVLNAIFQGLGIPPTLTGNANPGGFTNNFISLKTLTERLEYGRVILRTFWENELRLVQRAMGFRFPAQVVFDRLLTDESNEKRLWLDMWDRNLVSDEAIREMFSMTPDIEEVRVRREQKRREAGMIPPKASPYHDAEQEFGLKKIFAQSGVVTPSEVGVELDDKVSGEKSLIDHQADQTVKQSKIQMQSQQQQNDHQYRTERLQLKHGVHPNQMQQQGPTGVSGQGRPKMSKDSGPRKQKTVKPRTSASFIEGLAWAEDAQARVAKMVTPAFLKAVAKKTLRELTDEESRNFEVFKFGLLCQLPLSEPFDEKTVAAVIAKPLAVPVEVNRLVRAAVTKYVETHEREPGLDVVRRFQASVYTLYAGDYEESSSSPDGLS